MGFIYGLYPGLHFFINTFLILYLLNVFNEVSVQLAADPGYDTGPEKTILFGIAFFFVCNFALNHYFNFKFRNLKLGGKATISLRVNMMTQMLNFTPDAQEDFPTGKVSKIMESQVGNAIATTWAAVFKLHAALFQLGCQTTVLLYLQYGRRRQMWSGSWGIDKQSEYGGNFDVGTSIIIICIPVAMIIVDTILLGCFIKKQSQLSIETMDASDAWSSFLIESANMRSLVTTFRKGFPVAMQFKDMHKKANGKNFQANMFEAATGYYAKWFPTLLAIFFMIYGGSQVMDGTMPISVFVAAYGTCNAFGGTLSSIFGAVFAMGEGYASIQKISDLLNAPTKRRAMLVGQQRRARLTAEFEEKYGKINEDNIFISNLAFGFASKQVTAIPAISLEIEPGQILAISGGPALGKTTLLRLLGRQIIPTQGFIAYPGRWRIRFAEGLPRLFDGTLMYNLKFGNQFAHKDEEIWSLCEQIGLSSELVGQPELDVGTGGEKLALSDRICVSIIRALLSSVDLLLLANALDGLGEAHAFRVMGVLHEFIEFRGLPCLQSEYEGTPTHLKKKKTVFLSTKLPLVEKEADAIIALKQGPDDPVHAREEEIVLPSFWAEKGKVDRTGEEVKDS